MGGTAVGVQADAGRLADSQKVIDLAVERFGRIDILVNNAAVFPGSLSIEVTEETWDKTVDADLKGAFFLGKLAALKMVDAGRGGRIIFRVGSSLAVRSSPEAVNSRTPRLIRRVMPNSWAISSRANRLASSTMTVCTPLLSMRSRSDAKPARVSMGSAPETAAS